MTDKKTGVTVGVCVLVVIGVVMAMQPVSLMSGSGQVWMGVGMVGAGVALAFFLGAAKGMKFAALMALGIAVAGGLSVEQQMDAKRQEIQHSLDQWRVTP